MENKSRYRKGLQNIKKILTKANRNYDSYIINRSSNDYNSKFSSYNN